MESTRLDFDKRQDNACSLPPLPMTRIRSDIEEKFEEYIGQCYRSVDRLIRSLISSEAGNAPHWLEKLERRNAPSFILSMFVQGIDLIGISKKIVRSVLEMKVEVHQYSMTGYCVYDNDR